VISAVDARFSFKLVDDEVAAAGEGFTVGDIHTGFAVVEVDGLH